MFNRVISYFRDNSYLKRDIYPILIIIAIVLLGYYKIFTGANFFLHEDHVGISNYSHHTSLGNGWRADKGFGISFFFADPGIWHPWSIYTMFEKISPSRVFAYNFTIILLGIIAAIVLYFFIRMVISRDKHWIAVLLAPLVVFCASQPGYHFLRLSISLLIGIPLILMLLYNYYQKPKAIHLFYAAILFWFTVFFGNMWNLTQLLTMGGFFSIFYCLYYKVSFRKILLKLIIMYLVGGLTTVLLGFWTFYTFIVEQNIVGYMREKMITFPQSIPIIPDLKRLAYYFVGLLQAEWLPSEPKLLFMNNKPFLYTFNVAVVFPLVFISYLFRRASGFWEFSLKWLIICFYVHWGLILGNFIPGYGPIFSYLSAKSSKLITMYDFIFPLQITLIALFVVKISNKEWAIKNLLGKIVQKTIASVLFLIYSGLTVFSFMSLFFPEIMPGFLSWGIEKFAPLSIASVPRNVFSEIMSFNIQRLQSGMHWYSLLFYGSSVVLIWPFVSNRWLKVKSAKILALVACLLLLNNILLCWTIYPLNEQQLVFNQADIARAKFNPTDRFYFVRDKNQSLRKSIINGDMSLSEYLKKGYADRQIGLLEPPGLNISGLKSFSQINTGEFTYHIFNSGDKELIKHLRLYYGGPLFSSELLDMCAVNYYYSDRELIDMPDYLSLYSSAKQVYIYKNKKAWPYYYLAQKTVLQKNGEYLKTVQRGSAYINEAEYFSLSTNAGSSKLLLTEYSSDRIIFDFEGSNEELLVVADAWHPYWKALAGNKAVPIIIANEVFKGVRLPPGKYSLTLYFDNTPYKFGIYVSIIAWILFGLSFIAFRKKKMTWLET
ncbi:hypothetical protein ACFL4D_00305 [Candidatus Margulisiibacteriota bacterium]